MARVTLKDIAHEAGVSVMTVSNVVNGNLGRVSATTADEVRRVIAARGYVPNGSAQSLAAGRTRLVGLLVPPGTEDQSLLVSAHDVSVVGAVETTLRHHDNHLMLRSAGTADDVRESVRRWNLDGIVVMNYTDAQLEALDLPRDTPVVLVDAYEREGAAADAVAGPGARVVRVGSDDAQGGRLAAEHLLALGHRRIVFCGPTTTPSRVVAERLRGFREALEAAGVTWDDTLVVPANTSFEEGLRAGGVVAAEHQDATAVLATADILAAGVEKALARAGRRVPDDVSVVGYDDTDVAEYVTPSLTTVRQDVVAKGRTAATLLLEMIDGERPADPPRLGVELVVRESTAPPPSPAAT
ncbi:LacI family DNA-binding transcriptional regulator [Luteimicrobium sp. NPDC057192]|uniref:LacI family DNA-binding transcriptional regulator n=1 Tax=Luteimicrobium sp. NPDC057192 TaxID=3346042 RepID=UPI00363F968E